MKRHIISGYMTLVAVVAAHASTITWIGPTTIAGDSDVAIAGKTVFAYTGGSPATVNGVTFTPMLAANQNNADLQFSGFSGYNTLVYTSTSNNFAALSGGYQNILKGGVYNEGAMATVTLKNLVVDLDYTVQIWVNDPRSGATTGRYAVVDAEGPVLHYNQTKAAGGVGAYAVGTFTADSATQSFTLDGDVSTQLNAIQLRIEPVPLLDALYWDTNGDTTGFGTAGGTWGSDVNWSTNALGATTPDQPVSTTYSNALHLGTATTGLAAGTINLSGTQSFDTLSFGVASEALTITNGAIQLFATPTATVQLNSITNTIASPLVAGGKLTVRSVRPLLCDGFPTLVERTLFANATLADYTGAEAKMGGLWIANESTTPTPAAVYHWVNDGTNATFQVQTFDGGHTKVVKIALRQAGPHIAGRAVWAKHCDPDGNILGADFDGTGVVSTVATWFNTAGYGVAELKLLPYDNRFTQHRFRQFLTTNAQTIAIGANLKDFSTAQCYMAGGSINDDLQPASTFYFVNDGSNATFQVQCNDDVYTKCVKVELTQVGEDIQARLIYARYIGGNNLGHNFDVSGVPSGIATSFAAEGYGVRSIRLQKAQSTLALTANSAFNGPIELAASTLQLNGLLGGGIMTGGIINNGSIECRPAGLQQLSGPISGTGSFVMNGRPGQTITYYTVLTTTPAIIAENCTLADYATAGGVLSGESISGGTVATAPYHFVNNGTTAFVQLQVYNGGHTKVVKVEFTQVGADIEAKVLYSKHCSPDGNNVGADYDSTGTSYDYTLSQLSLYPRRVRLTDYTTYTGGTVVNSGELEVTTLSSLPALGGIVVYGGHLILSVPSVVSLESVVGGMNNPITVFAGGTLTLQQNFNAGHQRPIILDGGALENNADTYVNNLVLKNNAHFTGRNAIRAGYVSDARYVVAGTSPSDLNQGLTLVNGGKTLTIDVADVTGDEGTDLAVTGAMADMSGYGGLSVIKNGAGTMTLSADNSFSGPITINAGTLQLGADSALDFNNITLNNGALDMGAQANSVGTLSVSGANSTLVLGSGAIAFADSSGATWGEKLMLSGTLVERSVRFGTDSSGLTAEQLSAIEYNGGKPVRINSEGYLTAKPAGSIMMVR